MKPDQFEALLATTLAPPSGNPDRQFAARVSRRIAAEEHSKHSRLMMLRGWALDLAALAIFAGALAVIADLAATGLPPEAIVGGATLLIALWLTSALSGHSMIGSWGEARPAGPSYGR